jgi:gas vesicle protein
MYYNIYFCWHVFLKLTSTNEFIIFYHLKQLIMYSRSDSNNYSDSSNVGSKVLLGILAGAATGAILGILFAPDRGMETRRKIGEGSKEVANNLKDKFSEFVDSVADKYETAKESASDLLEQGKQKASSLASNLKSDVSSATGSGIGSTGAGSTGTGGTGSSGMGSSTGGNGGANRPSFQ